MSHLIIQGTAVAKWLELINEAESNYGQSLDEELKGYLVCLLQRFIDHPEIAKSVLALEFLKSLEEIGSERQGHLRDVGDKCLLFSGLFPARALRRGVSVTYFVELGQSAYDTLGLLMQTHASLADLYFALCEHFVEVMDVLQCMRELSGPGHELSVQQAEELWLKTGSQHALEVLRSSDLNILLNAHHRRLIH